MKATLLFATCLLAAQPLLAQRFDPNTKPPPPPVSKPQPGPALDALNNPTPEDQKPKVVRYPMTVALHLGTQGIGLEGRVGIIPGLNGRLGFSYLPGSIVTGVDLESVKAEITADAKFANIHLLAEYQPFKKADWFRVVGGFGYFMSANTDIEITPEKAQKYGDIVVDKSLLGSMKGEISWKGVAPYLGLGLLRAFPYDRFSVNLDVGTYMLPKPSITLDGYGAMAGNSQNGPIMEENLKDYRWLPLVQLNFTYKIR